jgi:hypothetical protein
LRRADPVIASLNFLLVTVVAFRFGPEIPDQSRPVLPFRPTLAPENGRFALENWAARKAAIHDASNSPGSGGV